MIGFQKDGITSYNAYAGGAPYNVACGIAKLNGNIAFLGKVGDDLQGEFLNNHYSLQKFKTNYLIKDKKHNTTLAFVKIDDNGERDFCFHRIGTADYQFEDSDINYELINQFDIIHVGSLMISEAKGMKFAKKVFNLAKQCSKLVSFDVNFRSDIFKNREEAIKKYLYFIKRADIVKYSEEELFMFAGDDNLKRALKKVAKPHQLVCVTLGSKGSAYYLDGIYNVTNSISINPIDTTGAGDAFFAGVLSCLDNIKFSDLNESKLDEIFTFANVCGALTTLNYGAIDAFPKIDMINEALKNVVKR